MPFDRLIEKIESMNCPVVAGLDPKLDDLPEHLRAGVDSFESAGEALFEFNRQLIDALHDVVPAVKPQCAYYEQYGWQGVRALARTIDYAKSKGMFAIADGKRNDIGSTMEAYAAAFLGETGALGAAFDADALTVNGYLGTDGIKPLMDAIVKRDRGIFVLCKTSNESAGELQDRLIDGKPVYQVMGELCEAWGKDSIGKYGYSGVGAVVGATYPSQLIELRAALPHTFFLVPGYGAQGGSAEQAALAFDRSGRGAIVNSSRAIMYAWKKEGVDSRGFAEAARREAIRMRDEINAALSARG